MSVSPTNTHCRLVDFSNAASVGLAHTFVEPGSTSAILQNLRKAGDKKAGEVEADQFGSWEGYLLSEGCEPAKLTRDWAK